MNDEPEIVRLITFDDAERVAAWRTVHDSVMGGVSSGAVSATGEAARFEGRVRLENNGGFASMRLGGTFPDLSEQDGLRLRVRGDGQVFKLSLRTDGRWGGVSWQVPFGTTEGEWTIVHIPFSELAPTWRGRLVTEAQALDVSEIREIGIVVADKQVGPFTIEVAAIDAWRAGASGVAPRPGSRAALSARSDALAEAIDAGADGTALLRRLGDAERILVVASPRTLGPEASLQLGRFHARDGALADRDLRVLHLMGDTGRLAGRTLNREQVSVLREAWQVPARTWAVALIGKDGGTKARWTERVAPSQVFQRIDAMPVRAREVERRRGH